MRQAGQGSWLVAAIVLAVIREPSTAVAQTRPATAERRAISTPVVPPSVAVPSDYVIGADDQLSVIFWRDKDMSADVTVRPDGKIALPLLNDIQAAGLTPEQLRTKVTEEAKRYVEEPNATIVIRQINSRKVFITGQVQKPGPYSLTSSMTVLQLISVAGGLTDYADSKKIIVMRAENGQQVALPFNYKDIAKGKNLKNNIELKPGDTIIVP